MGMDYKLDQLKVYRGLRNISKFMNTSPRTVKHLMKNYDLPVVREGKLVFTLTNIDYLKWREEMRGKMEVEKR